MNKYIIVNATALDRSGALSILRQFIENIPQDGRKWLIFVAPDLSLSSSNPGVRIEAIDGVKAMHKRLWWDALGLKRWLKKYEVEPMAAVSLQNTGFNVGRRVPTSIYYHQSLPFFRFSWNPLRKRERAFWFYKNMYPFFVNFFLNKDTKVFVQLDFIKEGFGKRFKHSKDLIDVYCPTVTIPKEAAVNQKQDKTVTRLLYPAMPHFYKNHRVIEEALKKTDAKVEVLFTIPADSNEQSDNRINRIGLQSFERIYELYYECDALLFPSYIETFGLPLLEAAITGLPIIAADLPYAREVLSGYDGVEFIPYNDPDAWARAIKRVKKGTRYKPIDISDRPGWKELFESITISQ